jgi:hypothetical protein
MPVGVMLLENTHLSGPGSMAHPGSYPDGVLFASLPGVMGRVLVDRPDLVREQVVATAQKLAGRGADVLTMNCGFGVLFQRDLVTTTGVTAVSSSLLLLPTLAALHAGKVGVVTFDKTALSQAHLAAAGWPTSIPLSMADVQGFSEWRLLDADRPVDLCPETMGSQLLHTARELITSHSLAALVLECSGMVPFAPMLRRELGCGVYTIFDALNLVKQGRNTS